MCGGTSKEKEEQEQQLTTGGSGGAEAYVGPQSEGTLGRDMELKKRKGQT